MVQNQIPQHLLQNHFSFLKMLSLNGGRPHEHNDTLGVKFGAGDSKKMPVLPAEVKSEPSENRHVSRIFRAKIRKIRAVGRETCLFLSCFTTFAAEPVRNRHFLAGTCTKIDEQGVVVFVWSSFIQRRVLRDKEMI
jgi:hypothetical protein